MWDLFQANRGVVVKLNLHHGGDYANLNALRNVYGLDVRCVKRGYWCLVGELLEDCTYVDYVAPHHAGEPT